MSHKTYIKEDNFDHFTGEDLEESDASIDEAFLKHEERDIQQYQKRNSWGCLRLSAIFHFSSLILFGLAWGVLVYIYGYDYPYGVNLISCTSVKSPPREFFFSQRKLQLLQGKQSRTRACSSTTTWTAGTLLKENLDKNLMKHGNMSCNVR